jgi:hypothetical protein
MDEALQSDDGSIMSAETPVEYTVGIIDTGDLNPWYMSYDLVEHLTGGAIRTASWARVEGSNVGIVVVPVTSAGRTIVTADIGSTITMNIDGDSGTLLDIIDLGETNDYLVIRPDTSAAGDSFDNSPTAGGTMTSSRGAFTAVQAAASTTGEQIWANLYNVTPIEADTHFYVYQGLVSDSSRARVSSITNQSQDWWEEGAFDRLFYIRDFKTDGNPIIDNGYISGYVRKGNTLYSNFEVLTSTTSGGRNPVPLSASSDLNNTTGYQSITTTAVGVDDFTIGDEIQGDVSGARGIITQIDGSSPTYTFHYYLIGDPQTVFQTAAEGITNNDATGTATKNGSAPANQGPALATWFTNNGFPSVTHGFTNVDIDDDGTAEGYGITINCNNNPLSEVYEWLKYVTRNGATTTAATDGIAGEQYTGTSVYLTYTGAVTGTVTEGSDVTQETSGATGIVVSHDTALKQILLRDTRGTFATHATLQTLTDNDTGGTVEIDGSAVTFATNQGSPFGSFAGGTFFGQRGVVLSNWVSNDENSFQLTDSSGTLRLRPVAISLEITNLVGTSEASTTDDHAAAFRLTGAGGSINKTQYSAAGGEAIGAPTLVVDTGITSDTPGKTTGGVLRLRDTSNNNKDYRLRYSSWATSTFTLANIDIPAADAGTNTTTVVEAGAFASAKRGDLVLNKTRSNAVSYITAVTDANTIQISPAITGQTTGDAIEINAIPIAVDTLDDIYVPLIDIFPTGPTTSVSIVYVSPIFYRVRVRNVRNASPIKSFTTDDSTSGTNRSVATIRTTDTIFV